MKFLVSQLLSFATNRSSRVNLFAILRFIGILFGLIILYTVLFHYIMAYEGREESWITGLYWTLTVMSTLGFGDITFHSDLGRLFSTVVLLSGIIFFLILLPFTFIEFFWAPWMKAQQASRAPTRLPEKTSGHVILIHFDAVIKTLIEKLKQYHYPYVLLVPDLAEALRLHDLGYKVMLGDLDSPKTYQLARVDQALLVASTASDQVNANVAATIREITEKVPIIVTANHAASVDILELAGCTHVLQLGEMMGQALARRVSVGETLAHPVGQFDNLLIAEATVRDTSLVGKTLRESCLRENVGINVLGIWRRGAFQIAEADTCITPNTVLVMAGTEEQIARYNELYRKPNTSDAPILIIGGGRVGKATGKALAARGLDYRIVERIPERIRDPEKYILGDAAELEVLEKAGIREAPTILITTHDDDMNIYLTIYCRRLRPDAQIISRAGLERNIATLHRSGADFVMSYASTGANGILNLIGRDSILMVTEGLDVFEVEIPDALVEKSIAECGIRKKTGCTVIALRQNRQIHVIHDPHEPLPDNARIILVGTPDAEERFLKLYK
ncbi:MAG TPA: NAD-binding protein [Oceanobacillus sp.]|nr:NAD-binding protein [Oceanobacillus sp.]